MKLLDQARLGHARAAVRAFVKTLQRMLSTYSAMSAEMQGCASRSLQRRRRPYGGKCEPSSLAMPIAQVEDAFGAPGN